MVVVTVSPRNWGQTPPSKRDLHLITVYNGPDIVDLRSIVNSLMPGIGLLGSTGPSLCSSLSSTARTKYVVLAD